MVSKRTEHNIGTSGSNFGLGEGESAAIADPAEDSRLEQRPATKRNYARNERLMLKLPENATLFHEVRGKSRVTRKTIGIAYSARGRNSSWRTFKLCIRPLSVHTSKERK